MDSLPLRDVTEKEIETYWRDGVVHLPNILGMEWVERMRVALDRILDGPSQRYDADVNRKGRRAGSSSAAFSGLATRTFGLGYWIHLWPRSPRSCCSRRTSITYSISTLPRSRNRPTPPSGTRTRAATRCTGAT